MKEYYSKPESDITEFLVVDVFTASTDDPLYNEYDGGDPFGGEE